MSPGHPTRTPPTTRRRRSVTLLFTLLVTTLPIAGCLDDLGGGVEPLGADTTYEDLGFDGQNWPSLEGHTLTILDHGAFAAFDTAAEAFEARTGAKVVHVEANDAGSMLNRAVIEKDDPSFDVIYGIDNLLLAKALDEGIFEPYRPVYASRVDTDLLFFGEDGEWPATPVDHGYIGLNWDADHADLDNVTLHTFDDVARHASTFVTSDPRTSTPGLGFLIATIATYGESGAYTWQDYWADLFEGGVLVTAGWSEAYMQHFSDAGEWVGESARDRAIVTSYTESPAYEAYFGMPAEDVAHALVTPKSTFHQIQTMGIAKGTENLAVAQAWIEFTLTDEFQRLAAPENAVYPVTKTGAAVQSVQDTYLGLDPRPGSFETAGFTYEQLGEKVEGWVRTWTSLCETHDCA